MTSCSVDFRGAHFDQLPLICRIWHTSYTICHYPVKSHLQNSHLGFGSSSNFPVELHFFFLIKEEFAVQEFGPNDCGRSPKSTDPTKSRKISLPKTSTCLRCMACTTRRRVRIFENCFSDTWGPNICQLKKSEQVHRIYQKIEITGDVPEFFRHDPRVQPRLGHTQNHEFYINQKMNGITRHTATVSVVEMDWPLSATA